MRTTTPHLDWHLTNDLRSSGDEVDQRDSDHEEALLGVSIRHGGAAARPPAASVTLPTMTEKRTLVVSSSRAVNDDLVGLLKDLQVEHQTSTRRNLDGETAVWVLAATVGLQALPPVLNFLDSMANRRQIKKLKIGDIEIENPRKEDIQRFRALLDKQITEAEQSEEVAPDEP